VKSFSVILWTIPFLVLFVFPTGFKAVWADEVRLENGDRITGTVLTLEDKVLTIRTSYAGDLSIPWEAVADIATDGPVDVGLSDDTSFRGVVRAAEDGELSVKAEKVEAPLTFAIGDVAAINPGPDYQWTAGFNVGLDIEAGNTEKEEYHLNGQFFARTEEARYTVWAEYDKEYKDNDKTKDKSMGTLKYDHFFTEKWYGWFGTLFNRDEFKDLNLRSIASVGPGYQFFETPLSNLSAELGPAYINEDYDVDEDNNYVGLRWGLAYDSYFFDERVQFFHWNQGIWSLSDSEDIAVYTRTGFRVPLIKGITATLQYNVDWDNAVPAEEDEVDQRLLLTLGCQLGNYGKKARQLERLKYLDYD